MIAVQIYISLGHYTEKGNFTKINSIWIGSFFYFVYDIAYNCCVFWLTNSYSVADFFCVFDSFSIKCNKKKKKHD